MRKLSVFLCPMKNISRFSFLLVLLVSGCAQPLLKISSLHLDSTEELYKPLVVQIQAEFLEGASKNGFGFIVGEDESAKQFYIVTANHVVRKEYPDNPVTKIGVQLSWENGAPRTAELLDNYSNTNELDLALLRLDKKTSDPIPWKGLTWCRNWQKGMPVQFMGWKGKMRLSPPNSGFLIERIYNPSRIDISMDKIRPGNSGTPIILEGGGIVGMAAIDDSIKDKVLAVDIEDISDFVSKEKSCIWKIDKSNCDSQR
ncbi:MAG: serine protease [Candidatus Electrothrix sp. GM3_4]|nr:serine protease [Candidatus Electrothrix sp. GM3_4]